MGGFLNPFFRALPSDSQKCNGVKNDDDSSSEVPGAIKENDNITNFERDWKSGSAHGGGD